jgi:hypothetical protein
VHTVGDGPVVVERGEDQLDGVQDVVDPADVEEGLLLAREGGIREVLGCRARAHRPAHLLAGVAGVAGVADEALVCRADVLLQIGRESLRLHRVADLPADLGEPADVVDVEVGQQPVDLVGQAILGQEPTVGVRGGREAVRHRDARLGQVLHHLAEGGVLASDRLDVTESEVLEPHDVGAHGASFLLHSVSTARC